MNIKITWRSYEKTDFNSLVLRWGLNFSFLDLSAAYGVSQSRTRLTWLSSSSSSQSYVFSSNHGHVWMWESDYKESWVQKNWCFWTVVQQRRFLRVPWTARRSNQSILRELNLEYSLEGQVMKLKLQYFSHLIRRTDSF